MKDKYMEILASTINKYFPNRIPIWELDVTNDLFYTTDAAGVSRGVQVQLALWDIKNKKVVEPTTIIERKTEARFEVGSTVLRQTKSQTYVIDRIVDIIYTINDRETVYRKAKDVADYEWGNQPKVDKGIVKLIQYTPIYQMKSGALIEYEYQLASLATEG